MKVRWGSGSTVRLDPMMVVGLGLLALMVSGPFLLPLHTLPIPSFWGEWWAGALAIAAAVIGLIAPYRRISPVSLPLPFVLLIPAVLLTGLLLQFAFGLLVFPQLGLLYAAYLIWAAVLVILGRHLALTIGLARLADVLAVAFALGALAGSAISLAQWLGFADRVPWMLFESGRNFGNIAQENHFAHYSWLGIASVLYLRGRHFVSRSLMWVLVVSIGYGSVLSGSRSVFLYLLVILAALAWARRQIPHGDMPALAADAALLVPTLVALNVFGAWASSRIAEFWALVGRHLPSLDFGGNVAGVRFMPAVSLYENASAPSDRLTHLRAAWSAFVEQPWLGQGVGNLRWAIFRLNNEHSISLEHVHNFVFQLLGEFGAPLTIAVVLLFAFWFSQFIRQPWKLEHFWCGSVLGICAVHSQLEYPLWYSFFLGPTALLLGATDSSRAITLHGRRAATYLIIVALAGALILATLRSDYSNFQAVAYSPFAKDSDRERAWRKSMDRLVKLYTESLLSPWALLAITSMATPSRNLADERADLCEQGIRFVPSRDTVTRCAMHLAIAGRDAEAQKLILEVLRAYHTERSATVRELENGAQTFPEVVPLWTLSQQQ